MFNSHAQVNKKIHKSINKQFCLYILIIKNIKLQTQQPNVMKITQFNHDRSTRQGKCIILCASAKNKKHMTSEMKY